MAVDAKKIIKKLKGEGADNVSATLYLDKKTYEKFREACKQVGPEVSPSKVINELMKEFIDSINK